jgi:hypothetical protein
MVAIISSSDRLLATAKPTSVQITTQSATEMMMALPTFRCGSFNSEPLLIIVVKPLKAKTPSAVAPIKPAIYASGIAVEKFTSTLSANITPTTPYKTMPPILINPSTNATPSIMRLANRLIQTPPVTILHPVSVPVNWNRRYQIAVMYRYQMYAPENFGLLP